jgi:dihydrofolate reductase
MAEISLIAAVDRRGGIGYQNQLLYWLPNDLKRFKALTTGHTIVMGRRTFESLPKGALPNRRNIVLSRREDAEFLGAEHFTSLEEVLSHCAAEEEVFIIGGASLYAEAIRVADRLYLTEVDDDSKPADAFFPKVEPTEWKEKGRDARPVDEKHLYPYAFVDYERL